MRRGGAVGNAPSLGELGKRIGGELPVVVCPDLSWDADVQEEFAEAVDDLAGRCVLVGEVNDMEPSALLVGDGEEMSTVELSKVRMDLFERAAGRLEWVEWLWRMRREAADALVACFGHVVDFGIDAGPVDGQSCALAQLGGALVHLQQVLEDVLLQCLGDDDSGAGDDDIVRLVDGQLVAHVPERAEGRLQIALVVRESFSDRAAQLLHDRVDGGSCPYSNQDWVEHLRVRFFDGTEEREAGRQHRAPSPNSSS